MKSLRVGEGRNKDPWKMFKLGKKKEGEEPAKEAKGER